MPPALLGMALHLQCTLKKSSDKDLDCHQSMIHNLLIEDVGCTERDSKKSKVVIEIRLTCSLETYALGGW